MVYLEEAVGSFAPAFCTMAFTAATSLASPGIPGGKSRCEATCHESSDFKSRWLQAQHAWLGFVVQLMV